MKKIPLLFLATLITGLGLRPAQPVSAAISANNTTWWSVSEMIEFSHQVDEEREALCQGDQSCKEDYYYSMHEKGDKYSALLNFLETRVWLTSINPGLETIKIFYFDEDTWLKNMGIEEYADLTHIYFGWFDDWSGQIYNYDRDQFASGLPGLHTMYVGDETDYGPGWLPAWEEIELSVAGSDLAQNTSGKIDYAAFAEPYFNAQGYFDISSCLNAPNYEVGMECQLMFSGDQWASYFPPRNEIEPEDNTVSDESIDESVEPTAEPISEPTSEQPTSTENASEQPNNSHGEIGNNDAPTIEVVSQAQVLAEPIKAPNTGTMTNPCSQKTIEFPWWLIIVIALGNTIILWLFRPQKYHKSFKKGLDKKSEVR